MIGASVRWRPAVLADDDFEGKGAAPIYPASKPVTVDAFGYAEFEGVRHPGTRPVFYVYPRGSDEVTALRGADLEEQELRLEAPPVAVQVPLES